MSETTLPDLGSAKVRIVIDKSGMGAGLKSAEDDAKKSVAKIQESLMSLGKGLSASITAPIIAIGATAAASMESLNKAMITLRAGTGSVGVAMRGLHDDFLSVLRNADEPVQTIAQDMALLNQRTDMTGEGLQTLTEQFQILQKYTGEKPIREITRVFGDWSVASEDQVAVLDELYRAYQRTGVSLTELATNVVQYGAPMRVLGFSLHETIALFAKWNMEGVNTVNVMGGLRMMLAKFNAGGVKDAKAAFEGLAEAIRGAKDFAGGVNIANALMGGDKSGAFGVRNTNDTVAAIREGRFELAGLVNDLINSKETLSGIDAEGKTLGDTFGRFKNALVAAFDPLTKQYQDGLRQFGDVLSGVAGVVTGLVDAFSRLDGGAQVAIVAIAAIAAAAGPVLLGLGGLVAAWGLVGASMMAVAGPVGVAIAAIVALVSAIAGLKAAWDYAAVSARDTSGEFVKYCADLTRALWSPVDSLSRHIGLWVDYLNDMGESWAQFVNQIGLGSNKANAAIQSIGASSQAQSLGWFGKWKQGMSGGWDTLKNIMGGGGYNGEDVSALFGETSGGGAWQKIKTAVAGVKEEIDQATGSTSELANMMGKAKKAAVTLEDALSMRQGARPLEAMTAELRKVMEMAAKFPSVIDAETMALLTGKAFEGGGGKIPFAGAYDALMLLNPAMAETVLQYKAMEEAQRQFQEGMDLVAETAKLEAEAMREVFRGAEVDASAKEKRDKEKRAWDDAGQMFSKIGESLSQIGDAMGSKLLSGIGAVITAIMSVVMAYVAMSVAAAAAAGTAAAAWIAILGPIYLVMAAVMAVISLFGIFGGSSAEKVKTGWTRAMDEIGKKWNDWADRMTDALVEFVETGKFAFEDLVKSIGEDLLKIGLKWAVIVPVLNFMGVPSSAFAAKGLVNDGGSVSKFSGGGVVTRPMQFSMGMGLIGEGSKPAEAYVPLTRTRSGDLGVSVEGMATGAKVNVVVNNFGPTPVTKTETVDADGTRNIRLTIEGIVKSGMARGAFDAAAGSAWGLRRRGAAYG